MAEILHYLGEVLLMTVAAGLYFLLAPEGSQQKHIKFVISICLLAALLVPLFATLRALPEVVSAQNDFLDASEIAINDAQKEKIVEKSREMIEAALSDYLAARYESAGDARVELTLNAEDIAAIEIAKIRVFLSNGREKEEIIEDLSSMFLRKSEVEITVQ